MTAASSFRRRSFRRRFRILPAFALAYAMAALCGLAQDRPKPTEYQLKAQYLTDFGRFIKKWGNRTQPSAEEPFDLCVLGQDPFGASLDTAIKGEEITGAPVVAKRIARAQDATGCRILFISSSEANQLAGILGALGTSPVLTVADIPDFVKHGGMVEFVLDGNRVKFEINLASAQRAGLNLSSELLKVARVVRRAQ